MLEDYLKLSILLDRVNMLETEIFLDLQYFEHLSHFSKHLLDKGAIMAVIVW